MVSPYHHPAAPAAGADTPPPAAWAPSGDGQPDLARRAADHAQNESARRTLSVMSHELRTPMHGIMGMTELLFTTDLTDGQRECVLLIHESSTNLFAIITDMLDFATIEAGMLELEQRPFDLRACVAQVQAMVVASAVAKDLRLTITVAPDVPAVAIGDCARLSQVLHKLLANAIKFTPRGAVALSVSQRADPAHGQVELTFAVRDTGIGIPSDRQGLLFHPFSPLDATTTRAYGGIGLGLAICQRLVKRMGGQIHVVSTPGQGSTFSFTIRAEQPAGPRANLRPPV